MVLEDRAGAARRAALRQALATFPRLALATLPTPVEKIVLENHPNLWIKRDDLASPFFGGNKIRKLEFILADEQRRGTKTLITAGAHGSHHVLSTALFGRQAGFDVAAVLFPQPETAHSRAMLAATEQVARVRKIAHPVFLPFAAAAECLRSPKPARWLTPGGSSRLGGLGYAAAALELAEQVAEGACPKPDAVVVALGTCGTAAGLWAGLAAAFEAPPEVIAVRVVDGIVANAWRTRRQAVALRRLLLGRGLPPFTLGAFRVIKDQLGRGYGFETALGKAASESLAQFGLEPTYTAKAAAGFLAAAREAPHARWMLIHTAPGASAAWAEGGFTPPTPPVGRA